MRVIRTRRYKLIHNLNYKMPFPIDQDFYISPTFTDLLNRTKSQLPTHWYKNLTSYYYRSQWELYRTIPDRVELKNLVHIQKYQRIFKRLKLKLHVWMNKTKDPWLCSPDSVYENIPTVGIIQQCMPLHNL